MRPVLCAILLSLAVVSLGKGDETPKVDFRKESDVPANSKAGVFLDKFSQMLNSIPNQSGEEVEKTMETMNRLFFELDESVKAKEGSSSGAIEALGGSGGLKKGFELFSKMIIARDIAVDNHDGLKALKRRDELRRFSHLRESSRVHEQRNDAEGLSKEIDQILAQPDPDYHQVQILRVRISILESNAANLEYRVQQREKEIKNLMDQHGISRLEAERHQSRLEQARIHNAPLIPTSASTQTWQRIGFAPSLRDAKAKPILIALIDSGLQFLPEVSGKIWMNKKDIPFNGKDDDKNGYVDDFIGYNFAQRRIFSSDRYGHGTYSASILTALNPNVKLMPLRVSQNGTSSEFLLTEAILYAVNNGAKIIQISLGVNRRSRLIDFSARWAQMKGVLVLATSNSQGQDTSNMSPAASPGVLTVGSCDDKGKRSKFSGWGAHLDLVAPGENIVGLRAMGTDFLGYLSKTKRESKENRHYVASGTCSALPQVTAAASLIWQKYPKLTADQVKQILLMSCDDLERPGWDKRTGMGRLNIKRALSIDPKQYLHTRLTGARLGVYQKRLVIQVQGQAVGTKFRRRLLQLAYGEKLTEPDWKTVGYDLTEVQATKGTLGFIPFSRLDRKGQWWVRSVVEDRDGKRWESRGAIRR